MDKIQELNVYSIISYDSKFLILRRPNDLWEFPGGGVDFGEEPLVSARRELKEETSLVSSDLKLIGISSAVFEKNGKEKHAVYIVYNGTVSDDRVFLSGEHKEYRWLTKEELKYLKLGLNAEDALNML